MYPKRKDLFVKWSKAMVDGATVDKPNYSPASKMTKRSKKSPATRRRKRRKRKNAKTD